MLHFRKLSDGSPHPSASKPSIVLKEPEYNLVPRFQICENVVGLMRDGLAVDGPGLLPCEVYDWKTGEKVWVRSVTSFSTSIPVLITFCAPSLSR